MISATALEIAEQELAAGIRGGSPGFGRFRGLRVDEYQRSVGLALPPDPTQQGWPWCASAIYWCFLQAADQLKLDSPCPRTAGAIHMFNLAQQYQTQQAARGCVFVLDRGQGRGHVGFVEDVAADGVLTTLEPDTSNVTMSATGDCWGVKHWNPADGKRGVLLGYLAFG